MDIKKIKEKAKKNLSKNKKPLLLATLILIGLSLLSNLLGAITNTTWLSIVLSLIVEALLMLGFVKMATKAARGKKVALEQLFSKTEMFFKYLGLYLTVFVILIIMFLLASIAFKSLAVVITYQTEINYFISVILIAFGLLLESLILLASLYLMISFSQVLFILNDEPKLSVSKILSKSFDMMEDYVIDYFLLILSFIGWFILGIFTLGILYIWLIPYVTVTCAIFYEKIKKEYIKDEKLGSLFNDKDAEEALKK